MRRTSAGKVTGYLDLEQITPTTTTSHGCGTCFIRRTFASSGFRPPQKPSASAPVAGRRDSCPRLIGDDLEHATDAYRRPVLTTALEQERQLSQTLLPDQVIDTISLPVEEIVRRIGYR
jgi:hypothetical protein